ncbi:MAG: 3-oxoacyl-[acyl-carrier-protein] reductase [Desulfovibrionaceae bacterium]|nr:3-oxoacyl-[acyl-carrier-protein] reductase [Desulfovibrionaceae bacterium]MBF0513249.1 3-oxoacyl-[acyl-carrier-protein] reductase [Desulfovibrionaceae bacterium]
MTSTQRIALVTGGSRGIGAACAKRLAADGFSVYLTYVSRPEAAQAVCEAIAAGGGTARAFALDTADRDAVAAFFGSEIKDQGVLQVLVNNAGVTRDGLIMRMKDEDWDAVIGVNLSGAFACLREAAKIMLKQRSGRIVNITSVVGMTGNAGQANYASAKAGLIGLTKAAALELASRGVTVNAVAPGFIETDMTASLPEKVREELLGRIPLKRLGQAEDVAAAVSYLASDQAAYVTGQVLSVNGGMYM